MHPGVTNNPTGQRGINTFPDPHKSGSGDMPCFWSLAFGQARHYTECSLAWETWPSG